MRPLSSLASCLKSRNLRPPKVVAGWFAWTCGSTRSVTSEGAELKVSASDDVEHPNAQDIVLQSLELET